MYGNRTFWNKDIRNVFCKYRGESSLLVMILIYKNVYCSNKQLSFQLCLLRLFYSVCCILSIINAKYIFNTLCRELENYIYIVLIIIRL